MRSDRRSVLTGLASLPVLSTVALGRASSDARLIELGSQFETAFKKWAPIDKVCDELADQAATRAYVRLGISPDRYRLPDETMPFLDQYEKLGNEIGHDKVDTQLNDAYGALDALSREIWSLPCETLDGLRVKARTASFTLRYLWRKPFDELDWDEKAIRQLVAAVCALTGLAEPTPDDDSQLVDVTDEDEAIGLRNKRKQAEQSGDRMFELVSRYEQECAACNTAALIRDGDVDRLHEMTVTRTMSEIIQEEPEATTPRGAIAAIEHVMNDQDFFEQMEEHVGEKMLWLLLRGARDYVVDTARYVEAVKAELRRAG